jgi:hypothetical protein
MRSDGHVRCTFGNSYIESAPLPGDGRWTHVGCTFDGQNLTAYANGDVTGCYTLSAWNPLAPAANIVLGMPFVGGIDNLHVLDRTLSSEEMCQLAGRPDCMADCPGH